MKARASRNAREAFRAERARASLFDEAAGASAEGCEAERRGDYDQPAIFRGTLKGYQLKGMNWLANLYDQVRAHLLFFKGAIEQTYRLCVAGLLRRGTDYIYSLPLVLLHAYSCKLISSPLPRLYYS